MQHSRVNGYSSSCILWPKIWPIRLPVIFKPWFSPVYRGGSSGRERGCHRFGPRLLFLQAKFWLGTQFLLCVTSFPLPPFPHACLEHCIVCLNAEGYWMDDRPCAFHQACIGCVELYQHGVDAETVALSRVRCIASVPRATLP